MAKRNIIAFLDPEPPSNDRDVKELFVDREKELQRAINYVRAVRVQDPKRILAIVGQARVGKSHLLKRVVMEVKKQFQATIHVKVTPGHGDNRAVLREMLNQISVEMHNTAIRRGLGEPEGRHILEPLEWIQRVYSDAIAGHASSVEVSHASTIAESLKNRLQFSMKSSGLLSRLGGLDLGLEAAGETTRSHSETASRTVKVNAFQEDTLCDLVSLAHELIYLEKPRWNTLLVVDDFDILQRSPTGFFEPGPLLQQLYNLAQVDGLHILTTVREDTCYQYPKSFLAVTFVTPFEQDEHLRKIYQRHVVRHYGGEDPLEPAIVDEIARRTEGLPGEFIRWLKDFWDDAPDPGMDLQTWFQQTWKTFERGGREAAEVIKKAALERGGYLLAQDAEIVRRTSLNRFVLEDYSSRDHTRVDPMTLSFIRESVI